MTCAPDCASAAQTITLSLLGFGTGLYIGRVSLSDAQAVVAALAAYVAAAAALMWAG